MLLRTLIDIAVKRRLIVFLSAATSLSAARRAVPTSSWFAPLHLADLTSAARSHDPFLKLMAEEFTGLPSRQATFVMGCFWHGEAELGSIDGVIATVPGNVGSREVVKVTYNPAIVSYEQLLAQAQVAHVADDVLELTGDSFHNSTACAATVVNGSLRADEDGPKFYLRQSPLRAVPMTAAQACRVNGALLHGRSPLPFLSPAQQAMAKRVLADPDTDRPDAVGVPIDRAWALAGG